MKNISWDTYELFLEVARHGGLSGAAGVTGLSPATIGRRMLELEGGVGRPLFFRSRTGYQLTPEGAVLFEQVQEMEGAARRIDAWQQESASPLVRIACGTWLAWWMARHHTRLQTVEENFRIDMFIAERRASLAHRESDIGIRAFEPEESNLAARAWVTTTGIRRSPQLPSPPWWRAERTSSTETPASTAFMTDWLSRCRSLATMRIMACWSVVMADACSSARSLTRVWGSWSFLLLYAGS
jgi:DNA-binding transcriptional LysR family regulator